MLKYHIQTIEVGASGAGSITFSNIPQEYDDLLVEFSGRSNRGSTITNGYIRLNGDTSSSYSFRYLWQRTEGIQAVGGTNDNFPFQSPGGTNTANVFDSTSIVLPNYSSSTTVKSIGYDNSYSGSGTSNYMYSLGIFGGVWNKPAPITSISFEIRPLDSAIWVQYSSASLYGIKRGSSGEVEVASGGAISYSGGYTIHTFQSSGTFVANRDLDVEYLVVGGGGGGGWNASGWAPGGGGAGGYRCSVQGEMSGGGASAEPKLRVTSGESYLVQVGSGGPAASVILTNGANGGNSSFGAIASLGGGGGGAGSGTNALPGSAGGSGGGGGSNPTASGTKVGGLGTTNQGYSGGAGVAGSDPTIAGGGGGGAGGIGEAGGTDGDGHGGDGGAGVTSMISGIAVGRGGGGGGGTYQSTIGTGVDGGGNGGRPVSGVIEATNGVANTGGGGGGDNNVNAIMGNGGSGIVIIRYLTPA